MSAQARPSPLSSRPQHPRPFIRAWKPHVLWNMNSSQPPARRPQSRQNVTQTRQNASEAWRPYFSTSRPCWLIWTLSLLLFSYFIFFPAGIKWQLCGQTALRPRCEYRVLLVGLSGADATTCLLSRSDGGGSPLFWWGNANEPNCSSDYLADVQ